MRQDTLLFLLKDDTREILLAMKKRGFGMGKFNGVGGKVVEGESIAGAAVREAREEIGVVVATSDLHKTAELQFRFLDKPDWSINCDVFLTRQWEGVPTESEEMAPEWFSQKEMPFDKMWLDDKYWLPNVLRGDFIKAQFYFNEDGSDLLRYDIAGVKLVP